jgi:hypothetical protein
VWLSRVLGSVKVPPRVADCPSLMVEAVRVGVTLAGGALRAVRTTLILGPPA